MMEKIWQTTKSGDNNAIILFSTKKHGKIRTGIGKISGFDATQLGRKLSFGERENCEINRVNFLEFTGCPGRVRLISQLQL